MNKQIILLDKQFNNKHIKILYSIITENIITSVYYVNSKKEYKKRLELHPNHNKQVYKKRIKSHSDYNIKNYHRYKKTFSKYTNKRQRELGFVIIANNIIQDKDIKINQHHINNMLVIPIPEIIHRGNLSKREKHRRLIDEHWISEFYPINRIIKSVL